MYFRCNYYSQPISHTKNTKVPASLTAARGLFKDGAVGYIF